MLRRAFCIGLIVCVMILINVSYVFAQHSFDTAVELPLNDSVSTTMTDDQNQYWWKVTTTFDGKLVITTVSDEGLKYDIYIYDAKNYQVALLTDRENQANLTVDYLSEEAYYIKVARKAGTGNFTISSEFTPTSLENDTEPNGTANNAAVIEIDGSDTGHLGYYSLGIYDSYDWWEMTSTSNGSLIVSTASDETLDIDLYIYDQYNNELAHSIDVGSDESVTFEYLGEGTFYVTAIKKGGQGSYTISIELTPATLTGDAEPNNARWEAAGTSTGTKTTGNLGYYGSSGLDLEDYFSFNLSELWDNIFIRCEMSSTLEADIYMYNASGGQLAEARTLGTSELLEYSNISAGNYYFKAERIGGYGSYIFVISQSADTPLTDEIAPPSDVVVTDVPGDHGHSLLLTWTLSPDDLVITNYNIYRSMSSVLTEALDINSFDSIEALNAAEADSTILIATVQKGQNSYTDPSVPLSGVTYYYWVEAFYTIGSSEKIAAEYLTTGVEDIPIEFSVSSPYPNPFNPSTTIQYAIPSNCRVMLAVYDILGRKVTVLEDRVLPAGIHTAVWDGRNEAGLLAGSGVYLYRLKALNFTHFGKVTFVR